MTKPIGRREARLEPADDARPMEPPSAQNRCRHANSPHHSAAAPAATLLRAEPSPDTMFELTSLAPSSNEPSACGDRVAVGHAPDF